MDDEFFSSIFRPFPLARPAAAFVKEEFSLFFFSFSFFLFCKREGSGGTNEGSSRDFFQQKNLEIFAEICFNYCKLDKKNFSFRGKICQIPERKWNNNKTISSGAQYVICTVKLDEEKSKKKSRSR